METKEYRLTDVCEFQGGTQPPKEEWINELREGYVRMLQIRDFTQDKTEHVGYVKDTKKLNKCKGDDILIGRYGASVGKILTGLAGAYNVAIIKTVPNEKLLLKKYLYFVLTGTAFQNFINTIGARAAQAGFNKDDLSLFKIHLPTSLENQAKIIKVLERADELIKKRKKSGELLDKFLGNTYLKMFGNNPNKSKWDKKTIDRLCTDIVDCVNKTAPLVDYETDYLMIRTTNIRNHRINFLDSRYVDEATYLKWTKRLVPKIGDIIFTREAPIGEAAIIDFERKIFLGQRTMLFRPNTKVINPKYLLFQLMGSNVQYQISKLASGSTVKHLSVPACKKFEIEVPPLELQNLFSEIALKVDSLKEMNTINLNEFKNLFNSLSQKVLRGQLELTEMLFIEEKIKVEPEISGELIAINTINKEIDIFHWNQPHTDAPDEIDNKIRQLETELQIRGEVKFDSDYVKYRIVKGKFKDVFTFDQLWQEITKFPFETIPEYDEIVRLIFKWLEEESPFLKQTFSKENNQLELIVNETA